MRTADTAETPKGAPMMWSGTWDTWTGGLIMVLAMLAFWRGLIWLFAYAVDGFSLPAGTHPH